jgi:hypothetical protein
MDCVLRKRANDLTLDIIPRVDESRCVPIVDCGDYQLFIICNPLSNDFINFDALLLAKLLRSTRRVPKYSYCE